MRNQATTTLALAREELDEAQLVDPLEWWPGKAELTPVYPLAKMLLAIPASSADNERSFSSASYTLDARRYRTDVEHFRMEHRIRRFLTAGATGDSQEARERRVERVERLLTRFSELLLERRAAVARADEDDA